MAQDLPGLDKDISELPSDILKDLADAGRGDLFFFDKAVLGYKDMTEDCHGPLCAYVQHNPKRFKRLLMPRDHFKSSVVTIGGTLWLIANDPNHRIHIKNEKEGNSARFLRAIQNHATSNRIFRTLYSDLIPPDLRKVRWNDLELDFAGRTGVYPEPTVSGSGMTSATTSNHFSHITIDDPISRAAIQSESLMKEAIERLKDALPLLSRPLKDTIWLVGTRWGFHDVYSWWDKAYGALTGKFSRSAIEDGEPIFPELISLEFLDMQRQADEYLFSCIYMNNPRNQELQDLDVESMMTWQYTDSHEDEVAIFKNGEVVEIVKVEDLEITVTVDPAPAEKATSDRNAINTLGVAPKSGIGIVLDQFAKRCTPLVVIEHLFYLHKRFYVRKVGIENTAYQASLKYFVQQECERRGVYMNIVPLHTKGNKPQRIRGLQPVIKMGRLAVHPTHQLLKNEISEFPLGEHDDAVDSLSMQLQIAANWYNQERIEKFKRAEELVLAKAGIITPDDEEFESMWFREVGRWANIQSSTFG